MKTKEWPSYVKTAKWKQGSISQELQGFGGSKILPHPEGEQEILVNNSKNFQQDICLLDTRWLSQYYHVQSAGDRYQLKIRKSFHVVEWIG